MNIDFDIIEQGEWFQFFESTIDPNTGDIIYNKPKGDARVQLRSIVPYIEAVMDKRTRSIEHVHNPKTRSMERLSYYPEQSLAEIRKEREDTWDYAITGFENFKDRKTGKVIECTRANKIKLMKIPVFDRFVARCLQIIADSGIKEKETEAKN
jgi:hypothetical protein